MRRRGVPEGQFGPWSNSTHKPCDDPYPRQHELSAALREIGRVERTLFIIDWVLGPDMRQRAHIGLNKGESHHALKNALRIGRRREIRDRSSEGQHYRIAGLNLLAAIVICWNTVRLSEAVRQRKRAGLPVEPERRALGSREPQ